MAFPFQINSYEEYQKAYEASLSNPDAFWENVAQSFVWKKKWDKVRDANFREGKSSWFEGAQLNITENCLDRHVATQPDKIAIIWEPNDPSQPSKQYTYRQLYEQVCQFARALSDIGVKKGDRICIYMGMVPELAIAMLACARIGAIHSVIFGGFSAQSIADRLQDAQAKFMITADGSYRGTKEIPLKFIVDDALVRCPFVEKVVVLSRTFSPVSMIKGRDLWWDEIIKQSSAHLKESVSFPAAAMESEDPLFILYTSGSTGKPKGVVHSSAGYMLWTTYSFVNVFNYQPDDIFFCTADLGWITGHSYILYGPLLAGATSVMFEGIPTWPNASRYWQIVEKYKTTTLYTSPTAIRSLMKFGASFVESYAMDSLRVLGTVGEPINREAWEWYHDYVGSKKCPIVDTWWQTETGGFMIANMAHVIPFKPTYATLPLPGIHPCLVNEQGEEIEGNNVSGILCIKEAWPSVIRTTYGDHKRFLSTYFEPYPSMYYTGDGAFRDENGFYKITGRIDDVLNVSGHRIGTAEVEDAINQHKGVIESAIVGYSHDVKGTGIYAFVVYEDSIDSYEELLKRDIIQTVERLIGPISRPDKIQFVQGLPKTRSGKIMRRILRKVASSREDFGDLTTLVDHTIIASIWEGRIV